jgi:hypothetical protein
MNNRNRVGSLVLGTSVFCLLFVAWVQRLPIYDWYRLRDYQQPAQITQLALDTTMTNSARHVFSVQHPEIDNKSTFNSHCGQEGEQTIVLGCYVQRQGIYVLGVDDVRLSGVEQVTAAHEMLHAAYDRLSKKERQHLDDLINQTYASLDNQRIKATIEAYKKAGADITNELHSILGTEVRVLPTDLETYYKKYFTDRAKIVGYSEQYQQAFTDRKNKVGQYDLQLSNLKNQIEANQADLDQKAKTLETQRAQLDQALAAKQYDTYNAGVPAYNSAVRSYNAEVESTKQQIDRFNQLLGERNAIALEEQQLFQAIDSRNVKQAPK